MAWSQGPLRWGPMTARLRVRRDQRDDRERDAEAEHHLREHQGPGGVGADGQQDDRGDQGDHAADQQGDPAVEQALHDRRARVGADGGRGQAGREQADGERDRRCRCRAAATIASYAPGIESVPGTPRRPDAASSSRPMLTAPAMASAMPTSHRVARSSSRERRAGGAAVPVAGEGRVHVDRVRHDGRAEHRGGEQDRVGAVEARDEPGQHAAGVGRRDEQARRGTRR